MPLETAFYTESHIILFVSFRDGISHIVVYHDISSGLMIYTNRGRPSNLHKLKCPAILEAEIAELRHDLRLKDGTKLLLLVSMATDSMIRQVSMHPKVWFCDVTAGTNLQKRDLFVMAVRNPTGKTFPGNLTIIPSGKRWVFVTLFQVAFLFLYGAVTCSRNRINLHDEDHAEYGSFENAIQTVPEFKSSKTKLCVFHGVWQPFKELVFKFLPRKSGNIKELSALGKQWGENEFNY